MNRIAVLYATREGHTQRIAERVATDLRSLGFTADVHNVRNNPAIDLNAYGSLVLAASVHLGKHEREMVQFVRRHLSDLERMPTAFLSVTLSEAGAEQTGRTEAEHAKFVADVNRVIEDFVKATGWHPRHILPVAGALVYSQYNFLVKLIMKRIARAVGAGTDTSRDYEYTDWVSLDHFVQEFAHEFSPSAS